MSGEGRGERLTLVTDFGSLRVGDLVVVKCDYWECGRAHRGMLLEWVSTGLANTPDGRSVEAPEWLIRGRHRVTDAAIDVFRVSKLTVARRIVYRVDTGLGSIAEALRNARTLNEDLAARAGRQSGKTLGAYERYHAYRKALKP